MVYRQYWRLVRPLSVCRLFTALTHVNEWMPDLPLDFDLPADSQPPESEDPVILPSLSAFGTDVLLDLSVEDIRETNTLVVRLPLLLISGFSFDEADEQVNIPTHNIGEVIDGLIAVIRDQPGELPSIIPGPDFAIGGIIKSRQPVLSAYKEGKGGFWYETDVRMEEQETGGRLLRLCPLNALGGEKAVRELVCEHKISGIMDVFEEKNELVIKVNPRDDPRHIIARLYRIPQFRRLIPINLVVLKDGNQCTISLVEALGAFIDYRIEHLNRSGLNQAAARSELTEDLLKLRSKYQTVRRTRIVRRNQREEPEFGF